MSTIFDLKKLEQKTYLSYHQDGLLDLIIGAIILGLGMKEVFDSSIWNIAAILLIIAYVPLKRGITFPRLGFAKFNVKRGGINMLVAGGVVLGVLMLLVFGMLFLLRANGSSSSRLNLWIRENPLILYGLLAFIGFGFAGLVVGLKRLFVYALLSGGIMIGGHFLGLPSSIPFLLLGGVILIIGAFLLIGFMQKYPVIKEDNHANQ
jgi:hypothetical protein